MRIITRPILRWPGTLLNESQREYSPFTASWPLTLELLEYETRCLRSDEIVMQVALREQDIRLDGRPRADAKAPAHPGVIITVESKDQGPLSFPCDRFKGSGGWRQLPGWQANVRAVALAMEALRKVDRYGITRHGEQYVGWKALGSGIPMGAAQMTVDEAARVLFDTLPPRNQTDLGASDALIDNPETVKSAYRMAALVFHPDTGVNGDADAFHRITEARDLLLSVA